jgi:hypothetical protein
MLESDAVASVAVTLAESKTRVELCGVLCDLTPDASPCKRYQMRRAKSR